MKRGESIMDPTDERDDQVEETLVACADCGAEVLGAADRAFEFGAEQVLCWQCAERRGGRYDAHQERWSTAPDIADLRSRLGREW
jgi:hypothetical protein